LRATAVSIAAAKLGTASDFVISSSHHKANYRLPAASRPTLDPFRFGVRANFMFSPRDIRDQYGLIDDYSSKYAIPPIANCFSKKIKT
jgi:hypothetical protein